MSQVGGSGQQINVFGAGDAARQVHVGGRLTYRNKAGILIRADPNNGSGRVSIHVNADNDEKKTNLSVKELAILGDPAKPFIQNVPGRNIELRNQILYIDGEQVNGLWNQDN
jgi:hypothetical protein